MTERDRAEEALRESERALRSLVAALPGIAFRERYDADWSVEDVSGQVAELVGYTRDDFVEGRVTWSQLIHPDDAGRIRAEVSAAVEARRPYRVEYRVRTRDGREIWLWEQGHGVYDDGRVVGIEGFAMDVTGRKGAEDALRESEERLRTVAESSPAAVFLTDADGACTFVSRAWRELTGQEPERAFGFGWAEAIHPADRDDVVDAFREALEIRASHAAEFRLLRPGGDTRWVLARSEPRFDEHGRFAGYGGSVLDVTEQQLSSEAERLARERAEKLHVAGAALAAATTRDEVARASLEGFEALGADATALYVLADDAEDELVLAAHGTLDPARLAGWERTPLRPGLPGPDALLTGAPVFLGSEREAMERYPQLESVLNRAERSAWAALPLTGASGSLGFVFLAYEREQRFDADDERTLTTLADQTAQALERALLYRLAEREREHTEQRYGFVAERAPIAIFETAADGGYVFVNERLCLLAGLSRDDVLGRGWLAAVHADDRPRVELAWDDCVARGAEFEAAFRLVTPAGQLSWVRCRATPVVDEGAARVAGYVGVIEDVTMERAADEAAQALAAERQGRLRAEQLRLAGEALARPLTVRGVAETAVEQVAMLLDCPCATITVLDEDRSELEVVGSLGVPPALAAEYRRFPLATPLPSAAAVRTGSPVWIERWEDAPDVDPPPALAAHVRSVAALPLLAAGRPAGALFVGYPYPRRFTDEERELTLAVASQCAEALGRVHLYEAEREARALAERDRDRVDALQRLTAALAVAPDVSAVTEAVIDHARAVLGSSTVAVVLLEEDRPVLQIERDVGYPDGVIDHLRAGIPLDSDVPVAEVTRTGTALYFPDMQSVDLRFPHLRPIYESAGQAGAVLPLLVGGRRLGGIVLVFPEEERFDEARVGELDAFARLCSQAFDRARLFEAEERALERTRHLQDLTAALSGAATPSEVGSAFFAQALPALGMDGGAVVLLSDDRTSVELVAHSGWPEEVVSRIDGVSIEAGFALCEAARTGEIVRIEGRDAWAAKYPESAATFAGMARSALALPLFGAGETVGAVGLTGAIEGPLGVADMGLLITMADQVAQALERARLFERESRARAEAEQRERLLRDRDEQLRLVHAAAGMGTWEWDPDTDEARWAPETYSLFGIREHERRLARRWFRHVHPEDVAAVQAALDEAVETGRSSMEYRYLHPERGLLWIRWEAARLPGERRLAGVSFDVTDRRLEEEWQRKLADLGTTLEESVGSLARMRRLAEFVAAELADYATVELPGQDGRPATVAASGPDAAAVARVRALLQRRQPADAAPSGVARVLATGEPELVDPIDDGTLGGARMDDPTADLLREVGAHSYMAVPLAARGQTIGALTLVLTQEGRRYTRDDLALAEAIASRAALAIEAARLYEQEHEVAVGLQQALLPPALDEMAGVALAARYEAGHEHLQIGGDWYDTAPLPDGRLLIAVGDVVGRGLKAAAAMSRLQTALAALAPATGGPAELVERLERFATEVAGAEFATVAVAMLDPGSGELRYATAGHPPPLLVLPDGEMRFLDDVPSAPLCGLGLPARPEGRVTLPEGALLVLYTDGLIERRGQLLDVGLQRLARTAVALRTASLPELADGIVERLTAGERLRDDVALLCVRLEEARADQFRLTFPARAEELSVARRAFLDWLGEMDVPERERPEVVLAVGEALANAVEHAYWQSSPGDVELQASCPDGELLIRVSDRGRWRDPHAPGDRGRGLGIIEELTDSLDAKTSSAGTTITMRRRVGTTLAP